ncbi:MAG: chemotaxis protein CheW [Gammaproteobacteria bacterium]|nr:chemotaxis protein CheW [Gammaproteobacteria bacterium]
MKSVNLGALHALEIPTRTGSLLVPSACIAEVVPNRALAELPLSPQWVLGVMAWRSRPVQVISLEALMGGAGAATDGVPDPVAGRRQRGTGKVVVFYPLPGRNPWEFFGVAACSEPQSRVVDGAVLTGTADGPDNSIIAMTVRLGQSVLSIPDMSALSVALYS